MTAPPALAVPRSGPCSPWVDGAAVEARPWVKEAAAKLREKASLAEGELEAMCAEAATAASEFLYEESGRIFSGDCVTPETRILTANLEWLRAGDLMIGDELLAFDEEAGTTPAAGRRFRESAVTKTGIVKRPCYELEFADGTVVRSSAGHRWLMRGQIGKHGMLRQQWIETKDLRLGRSIIKPLDVWEQADSYEAGYLAGAFDGEGNVEPFRVCFHQLDNEMLERVGVYLEECGYTPNACLQSPGTRLRVDGTERAHTTRLAIESRATMLRFLGSVRPPRLLSKLAIDRLGRIPGRRVALTRIEHIGEQDVVMLDTSSGTYFAEGLASHNCGPVTIRPVERPIDADSRSWGSRLSPLGWFASWGLAASYGTLNPGVMSHYGSTEPPELTLPYPVREILEVTIDGIVIPPAEYELRDFQTLVRMRPEPASTPTARYGWPTSQRQDLTLGNVGTFGVTFMFGNDPPQNGRIAARKLAEYLVVPQLGDATKYPRRVTSITRQGVSTGVTDIINVMQKTGSTGIYEVDLFLRSVNPNKLQRQGAVWSPDIGRNRRTAPLS